MIRYMVGRKNLNGALEVYEIYNQVGYAFALEASEGRIRSYHMKLIYEDRKYTWFQLRRQAEAYLLKLESREMAIIR